MTATIHPGHIVYLCFLGLLGLPPSCSANYFEYGDCFSSFID
ncbi:hypothetical protein FHU10_2579 [Serratia fonticola]|uniref:Uncharacterized protein n=1 Tax=Serratia fonticola TaxID=47917 RepID=A0A559T630_SERFO|nr:hypothetical protein FHU09_5130 [Serratia fonticola]TVZ70033.1 hypothetical protein FHU10_2579 [Serratia fonticola]